MLKQLNKPALVLALALAAISGSANAHRPWFAPSTTFVDDKEAYVTVDAAISEALFDFDHMPVKLDGMTITGPDGAARQPENASTGKRRSVFDLKLAQPGTYKISLVTQAVMGSYKAGGEVKRVRGTEESIAKEIPAGATEVTLSRTHSRMETFVTSVKADFAVFKPTGVGLEMVPLTHPNEVHVGDKVKLRFLVDGKPAADLPVSLVPGGARYHGVVNELRATTDANGELTVAMPEAAMYWLNATYPVSARGAEGGPRAAPPARRLSYIATFEALPQ